MNVNKTIPFEQSLLIKGCKSYYVCTDGTVYSTRGYGGKAKEPIVLKHTISSYGYPFVNIIELGSAKLVHRLVLEAFTGPCPEGKESSHVDGDRTNCHVSNLKWETSKENHARRHGHGTVLRGENHCLAKLAEGDVLSIRREYAEGCISYSGLATKYGISQSHTSDIVNRKKWSHI